MPARDRAHRAQSTEASSSAATASSGTCCVAPGHPGLAVPAELAGRPARRPRLRAARVRLARRRRRRRDGGGDRVAERARGRLRGRLGAPPRAGAAAAQRRPAVLHASAASPASTPRRARGAPSSSAASASRRIRPAAPGTRRSRRPSARAASASRRRVDGAEQVICATGFRRGFQHDPLLARLVEEHGLETEDRWIVLADDSTVPGAHRRDAHARARRRARPVGVPGGRHARRDEGRRTPLPPQGGVVSYTLRGRIETRLAAALAARPRRRRARAGPAQVVAARAGRADAR